MDVDDRFEREGAIYTVIKRGESVTIRGTGPGAPVLSGAKWDKTTRTVIGGTWTNDPDSLTQRSLYRAASNLIRARTGGTMLG